MRISNSKAQEQAPIIPEDFQSSKYARTYTKKWCCQVCNIQRYMPFIGSVKILTHIEYRIKA